MEHYDDAVALQASSNLLRTQILEISLLQKGHCGNLKWWQHFWLSLTYIVVDILQKTKESIRCVLILLRRKLELW